MPAPATIDDFLDLVRRSEQVEPERLESFVRQRQPGEGLPTDPRKLAATMVREGLLTAFQAEQLLMGKWRGFTIAGYRVLERLGTGGSGTVYLAEHQLMKRRVAIKVLPSLYAEERGVLERFQREAQAAAALDHPNIVRAYDFRHDGGLHLLVMEYVEGVSLQELLLRIGPFPIGQAADYARQAAIGLEHAHEAGLVHRDVKPANLLVDAAGTVKLLDLGLARFAPEGQESLTKKFDEGAVMGTADYLSPEQALNLHRVDIRADIYSLGATLYALLTGQPPFADGTITQKLLWHQMREPTPIREVRPEVPQGLATIVSRMMCKEPDGRYATPREVADALERYSIATTPQFLARGGASGPGTGGPVSPVRRTSAPRTTTRGGKEGPSSSVALNDTRVSDSREPTTRMKPADRPSRNDRDTRRDEGTADAPVPPPPGAGLVLWFCIAALLVAVTAVGTIGFFVWRALDTARPIVQTDKDTRPDRGPEVPPPPPPGFRLADQRGEIMALDGHQVGVGAVAFSRDPQFVLSTGLDGMVQMWDLSTRRPRHSLGGHQGPVNAVAVSVDGARALTGGDDKTVRIWELAPGKAQGELKGHTGKVQAVAFTANGQVVSAGEDKTIRLWDVGKKKQLQLLTGHKGRVNALATTPSRGRQVLTGSDDQTVKLWNLDNRKVVKEYRGQHKAAVTGVAFLPGGGQAASIDRAGTLVVWDVNSGNVVHVFRVSGELWCLAASDSQPRLATGGADKIVRVWDLQARREEGAFAGHKGGVTSVGFSPDGRHLVSGSLDRQVRVWSVPVVGGGPPPPR